MWYTKEEAEAKYPRVVFQSSARIEGDAIIGSYAFIGSSACIGSYARIESNAIIRSNACIGSYARIESDAIIGSNAIIESGAYIESYARIESDAIIGSNAIIESGAYIESRVFIASICSKYNGNIIPYKDKILIRIGCERHTASQWLRYGEKLAEKHCEVDWWNETGKAMLVFLISEAELYEKKYMEVKK